MRRINKGVPFDDFVKYLDKHKPSKWEDINGELKSDMRFHMLLNEQECLCGYSEIVLEAENTSSHIEVVKGYLGFKVDTDKFPKSPTPTKNLYLVTEYYDGKVGDIQTKPFEISYTAKSWNWANSSATNVSMSKDNTWKTHIMPLGDIYFAVLYV
mgnify:CR=1 FL=1